MFSGGGGCGAAGVVVVGGVSKFKTESPGIPEVSVVDGTVTGNKNKSATFSTTRDLKVMRITGREPSERTRGSWGGQDVSLILALRFHPVKTPSPFYLSSKL